MVLRILRTIRPAGAWAPLLAACAVATACSNNNPAVPDAFIAATMGVGPSSPASVCNFATQDQLLDVGTPVAGKPTTVQDGNSQAGASVKVSCSVTTSGGGFDLNLSVIEEGLQGGSVTITSPAGQGAVTAASGGSNITAVFQSTTAGSYRETDCTISFLYNQEVVPDNPPIAAGRIWGHLSCPTAQSSGATLVGADGGSTTAQCDGEADFLFEQCGQ